MNRSVWIGLVIGSGIGILLLLALLLLSRVPSTPLAFEPATTTSDVAIFLSEQSLSRMASETLQNPTVINFQANGQMVVTTQTQVRQFEPVIHVGLRLGMQNQAVAGRLQWIRFGFLTVPARWLPAELQQSTELVAEAIEEQTPPEFRLVGLTTTDAGVTAYLQWVGP